MICFSFPALANQLNNQIPDFIYKTLSDCYEKEKKRETELAKCISKKLQALPNPNGYRLHIHEDTFSKEHPNKLSLMIYDKYGQVLRCYGEALDTIDIHDCELTQGKQLTPSEQLSITPPGQSQP